MEANLQSAVLNPVLGGVLLLFFSALWIWLGLYWGKKAKNLDGFMLAGRNVGLALGAATCMATWVTSNTVMLAPVFALKMGVWGMLAYCTASFGLMLFAPLAQRIRRMMPNGYTSGDFMRLRYGKAAWSVFLMVSLVYSMAWLVSMGMAGGKFLQALSGIPYVYGMSVILLVCVIYTLFGGLYAVIGTDFIQSLIILAGVVLVGVVALGRVDAVEMYDRIVTDQPALLDVFMPVALLAVFNNMFFGFGEVFHNNVWWSRAFAMRDGITFKAFFLSGLFWFPIPIAAGFIGLCAGPLGINVPDPDMTGPLVAGKLLGSAGAVLVFIVLFCSLASSVDSLLAATADLITEDIYKKLFNPGATEQVVRQAGTWVILGLGLLTWILCALRFGNLIEVLFLSGPLVASTVWPVLAGLYWKRASWIGALGGMLLGSSVGLVCYYQIGWFAASLISAVLSMLVVVAAAWIFPEKFEWAALKEEH